MDGIRVIIYLTNKDGRDLLTSFNGNHYSMMMVIVVMLLFVIVQLVHVEVRSLFAAKQE
jgi:hypothetical protein